MRIGNKYFEDKNRTYIMGILNVTPDSFSDGGKYNMLDQALMHTEEMISDGADVIDLGGESTRPGFDLVGDQEELRRVLPIIEAIKKRFDIPLSIDTFHCRVAKEALACGVDMVNDIWGLQYEKNDMSMAQIIKEYDASVCIMHNSTHRYEVSKVTKEEISDCMYKIKKDLLYSVRLAEEVKISKDKIMIDPGVGFAKDYHMNMSMISNLGEWKDVGYPILLGTSGKSVIGNTLHVEIDDRLEGTLATTAMAVMSGCNFVRVHNVKSNARVIRMTEELMKYRISS